MSALTSPRLGAAILLSLSLHGGVVLALVRETPVRLDGGAPAVAASLGSNFADMVRGTSAPVAAEGIAEKVEPAKSAKPLEKYEKQAPQTPQGAADDVAVIAPKAARPVSPAASAPVLEGLSAVVPVTTQSSAGPSTRTMATAPPPPRAATATTTPDRLDATAPPAVQQANADTPRPKRRPAPKPARQQTAQGNSDRDAVRGSATGQAKAKAASAAPSKAKSSQTAGNGAAAANYAGQVLRKINRVRRPRGLGRGRAYVNFIIAPNGQLASLTLMRSSGNPKVDRAALKHIRRAAPFPPPPRGAKTRWSFTFDGQ